MNGLALARRYWEQVGLPAFARQLPEVLDRAAVGLAGEGSDCFGFDDALSRDHDWGPGFCLWLMEEDFDRLGQSAQAVYDGLPRVFDGWPPRRETAQSGDRVGCLSIPAWYRRLTGFPAGPETAEQWRRVPESFLAATVNGAVFQDGPGAFSAVRRRLLGFYPENVRREKLADRLTVMAQAGQYNYDRCVRRGETVAAMLALANFADAAMSAAYLLNRRYAPFYKWRHRGLRNLERLPEMWVWIGALFAGERTAETVEIICAAVAEELRHQGVSTRRDGFLLPYAEELRAGSPA